MCFFWSCNSISSSLSQRSNLKYYQTIGYKNLKKIDNLKVQITNMMESMQPLKMVSMKSYD